MKCNVHCNRQHVTFKAKTKAKSNETVLVALINKVKNIVEGDHRTFGSMVELLYGKRLLITESIGIDVSLTRLFV